MLKATLQPPPLTAKAAATHSLRAPRPAQTRFLKLQARRWLGVRVHAAAGWPDTELISQCETSFPDKGVANVEEARVLFSSLGYAYLDVRPELECEEGKVRGCVNIPIVHARRVYNPELRRKLVVEEPNQNWLQQVERRFPQKDAKLLVGCSDGKRYSIDALMALDEAGYTNIVGLRGGYEAWSQVFDFKLNRRRTAAVQAVEAPARAAPAASPAYAVAAAPAALREERAVVNGKARTAALERPASPARERERGESPRAAPAERKEVARVAAAEGLQQAEELFDRAALERALQRTMEGQAEKTQALAKSTEVRVRNLKSLLLECNIKLAAARGAVAAAEAEVKELEELVAQHERDLTTFE